VLVDPPKPRWWLLADTVMPPIGLAYIASFLRSKGIWVRILDCTALGWGWEHLASALEKLRPDVVGVGGPTCYSKRALRVLEMAKELLGPDVLTVAGGPHFSLLAEHELSSNDFLDVVVVGEGELTAYELVKAVEEGRPLKSILGLAFRDENGRVVFTGERPLIKDLDSLPMPAWDLLPMERYRLVAWGKRATMLVSSRGCPFNCSFCSERIFWRGIWRPHSPGRVVDEMELVRAKYGKDLIWFGDDTFNLSRERNIAICREILERGLDVSWGIEARADLIVRDRDILGLMKEAGLFWVLIGVEGASDAELRRYGKGITLRQVREAFRALREHDIITQAMFIIGERWDTKASILAKERLAEELDADFVIFTPLTPFPGTPLYELAKGQGWIEEKDWSKYDLAHVIMPTETLSRREVRALMIACYRRFFLRPIKLLKGLTSRNPYRRAVNAYFLRRMLFGR
ncbi:MAG TPA: radical SAM protein, partial [Candidatus Bathyarchaeota archaeon]|nr:radical SAM protein [Candidatus Bathyarchaeota archaeon]